MSYISEWNAHFSTKKHENLMTDQISWHVNFEFEALDLKLGHGWAPGEYILAISAPPGPGKMLSKAEIAKTGTHFGLCLIVKSRRVRQELLS